MGKRVSGGFVNLDPAISAILDDGQRRQVTRSMTKEQRRQASRNRMTFDISPELSAELVDLAAELSVPVSQLAEVLIKKGQSVTTKEELFEMRLPARSMRYEFVLFVRNGDTQGRQRGHR